jgi:sRNA-binding protein
MQRMNEAMQRATLRDARHHRPLDLERAQARYEALRAAERALVAVNEYAAKRSTPTPEPVQTPATHANRFARFFSDGERPKPDACKAAKGIWGRARRGVI